MGETLRALRERVIAATGPDRALDRDLALAFDWIPPARNNLQGSDEYRRRSFELAVKHFQEPENEHRVDWSRMADNWNVPPWSGSLDAALALVERALPGWSWEVRKSGFGDPVQAYFWNPRKSPGEANNWRVTLNHGHAPLAVLAALLSALESQADHGPVREETDNDRSRQAIKSLRGTGLLTTTRK